MAHVSASVTPQSRLSVVPGWTSGSLAGRPMVEIDGVTLWLGAHGSGAVDIVASGELLKAAVEEAIAPHRAALASRDDAPNVVTVPASEVPENVLRALWGDK